VRTPPQPGSNVELREIEVFLVLAAELHFGRAAERLLLTPSRVSQILRRLEHKLGGQLLNRTSRTVVLTPAGDRFLAEIGSPYDQLLATIERARAANRSLAGTLHLGLLPANSSGPHLRTIVAEFERLHPECAVMISEILLTDPLGPLRRGEIDVMATPLPMRQPDITVGPTLAREPMVLAVADDHPLAGQGRVTVEDLGSYELAPITDVPKELIDTAFPRRTPSGHPIAWQTHRPKTPHEVTTLVARGAIVHPTVPSFAEYFGQPGITYIPIIDMPARKSGLVWRRKATDPRLREFVRVAREILKTVHSSRATTRSELRQSSPSDSGFRHP
jgi:DNA-binding transcriptional LysR family regulator